MTSSWSRGRPAAVGNARDPLAGRGALSLSLSVCGELVMDAVLWSVIEEPEAFLRGCLY